MSDLMLFVVSDKAKGPTPGTWEFGTPGDGGRINIYSDSTMSIRICRVDSDQALGNHCAANARLIAAAPDLVAALRDLIDTYEFIADCEATKARAALAKAGL